ncbi:FAD-dependent oxidoreductase [Flavobacterium sp.]
MNQVENTNTNYTSCGECNGSGKKTRRLRKKVRLHNQQLLDQFQHTNNNERTPILSKPHLDNCSNCSGTGLKPSKNPVTPDFENYPHVAIIGGGIGGVALAVACLHRGIPFTLYERDCSFDVRSQGYGLTLQQASKAIQGFGIFSLAEGVVSTRHLVHTTNGTVIGQWGMRKWFTSQTKTAPKRTNIHIGRQALRLALLEQLGSKDAVKWGHQLLAIKQDKEVLLTFKVGGQTITTKADLVIGADGIRSTVRKLILDQDSAPLRYLECMVILGICPLLAVKDVDNDLLDSATVFQTANGNERIYIMPYDANSVMWQLSFPMSEDEAKLISAKGTQALKEEAIRRTNWHKPIPQIIQATLEAQISGYPVYDRELLRPEVLEKADRVTLLGDAAHPMSPFKGQGANQALLDALALARAIAKGCKPLSKWRAAGIRKSVLTQFEVEMLERSAIKVKDSADAAKFLHSEIVLHEGDEPRGRSLTRDER